MNINYLGAEKLLKKYLTLSSGILDSDVYDHCVVVANLCFDVTKKIIEKHPEFNLNPEYMKIVGLLHDIGKLEGRELHAYTGSKILEVEELKDIAEIIKTHTIMPELAKENNLSGNFLPKTLEDKILTYCDCHVSLTNIVTFQQRYDELYDRVQNNPKRINAVKMAYTRLKLLIDEIDSLLK